MLKYPPDWPENCPPQDATPAGGDLYRIVSSNPPRIDDLESYEELGTPARGSECRRRAISVFETREMACHRLRYSPYLGSAVAKGTLDATHGKLKLTNAKSGHIAWWCPVEVKRVELFGEVEPCR
jgi:hypothetical protein